MPNVCPRMYAPLCTPGPCGSGVGVQCGLDKVHGWRNAH